MNLEYLCHLQNLRSLCLCRRRPLPMLIRRRRRNVEQYRALLDPALVFWPPCRQIEFNSFHTFVVQVDRRDALQAHLKARGIGTAIHYPVPIHLQPAAAGLGLEPGVFPGTERQAGRILTRPVHQGLTEAQVERIAGEVNGYLAAHA